VDDAGGGTPSVLEEWGGGMDGDRACGRVRLGGKC